MENKEVKYDCIEEGCGECKVCKYLDFLDFASSVATEGSIIQRDIELDKYIKEKYGK